MSHFDSLDSTVSRNMLCRGTTKFFQLRPGYPAHLSPQSTAGHCPRTTSYPDTTRFVVRFLPAQPLEDLRATSALELSEMAFE